MRQFPKFDSPFPFVLYTDASAIAIVSMITQVQDGMERVIMYGSRKNNAAQQKYDPNRVELMSFAAEALIPTRLEWEATVGHVPGC